MVKLNKELKKTLISDLIDLLFPGRDQEIKSVGSPDPCDLEELSKTVLVRALLEQEVTEIEQELKNKILEDNFEESNSLKQLMRLARTWKAMKLLTSGNEKKLPEVFILDVLFLKECFRSLFPGEKEEEEEVLLTGVKTGKINVLTRKIEIETEKTEKKVEDVPPSSYRKLRELDKNGMPFMGVFHSHPDGFTPRPSTQDLDQFETYEDHGFQALGGIFTRNGFVRFFTHSLDFEIMITGTGVKKKGRKLYKIENTGI